MTEHINLSKYISDLRNKRKLQTCNLARLISRTSPSCAPSMLLEQGESSIILQMKRSYWLKVHINGLFQKDIGKGRSPSIRRRCERLREETSIKFDLSQSPFRQILRYQYYFVTIKMDQKLQLRPQNSREITDVGWFNTDEMRRLSSNRHIKQFLHQLDQMMSLIDQLEVTQMGS